MRHSGDWLPALPAGWTKGALRWQANVYSGGTPSRDVAAYWTDGTIPWLASGAVNQWAITEPSEFITERALRESSAQWVPAGAVVMGLAGQGKTKGMVARTEIRATCNQSMCAIVPETARLEHRFLHFWLSVNHDNIRNLAGGDKRDGLNQEHVRSIVVPLPPLALQSRIADYLDRETAEIDSMDAELNLLMDTLEERRQVTTSRLHGLDHEGVRLKWLMKEIDDRAGSRSEKLSLLSVSIHSGVQLRDESTTNQNASADLSHYKVARKGDMVLNRMRAFQGGLGIAPVDGLVSPDYSVLRMDPSQLLSAWAEYLMRSPEFIDAMSAALRGIGSADQGNVRTPRINVRDLFDLAIPLPDIDVQARIVAELDGQTARIDDMIADAQRLKVFLAERRFTLITEVVTGRKKVPA